MKIHIFVIFLILAMISSTIIFAQDMNQPPYVESIPQIISDFIGGASPYILIGLGILLFLVQKIAKIVGVIILGIGVVRLIFMFL
jgi:hypothetical protein